jgi:Cu(I)/Ag(I) efflux system membrane fusion protein
MQTVKRLAIKTAFFAVGAAVGMLLYGPLSGLFAGTEEVPPPPPEIMPPQPTDLADLSLGPRAREVGRRKTETVAYRHLQKTLRLPATLQVDETREKRAAAWVAGRIDDLFVDSVGVFVAAGQPLARLYSPALETAQKEYLLARRLASENKREATRWAGAALKAARRKLELYGVSPAQIATIEKRGAARDSLEINSPLEGTVMELLVREGAYVKEGTAVARIADLSHLWAVVWVHEDDLAWIHFGQDVGFQAESGESFRGRVAFIDPVVGKNRAVRVRINVPNPEGALKPGLFARATLVVHVGADGRVHLPGLKGKYLCRNHMETVRSAPGDCPIDGIPLRATGGRIGDFQTRAPDMGEGGGHEGHDMNMAGVLSVGRGAILPVGMRRLAYRRNGEGVFELVDVRVGPLAQGFYPVLAGLEEHDVVASAGNFLLDSEEQLPFPSEEAPPFLIDQAHCPVMGGAIDRNVFTDYKGMRVFFCCAGCEEKFLAEPEKYLKALEAMGERPIEVPGG